MRNKFVYSCNIKIHVSGFVELLESILCLLLDMEVFSLQNIVEMPEEVEVSWLEVRRIWQMRQNFVTQFVQLLNDMRSGIVVERNRTLSVDRYWLQVLQLLVHLIDFLWRRQWHPTPVLLLGKSDGRRSLEGCSPWGR